VSERETQQPGRLPGVWTLLRDVLTFFGGWTLIFLEVARPEVRESVLLLGGSAIAVPGAIAGGATVVAAVTRRAGTGGSPSSSPDPARSSSSPP